MSLDRIKCHNNLVIVKWEGEGINKIPKPLSMEDQLNVCLFLIVLGLGVPHTNKQFPEKRISNCYNHLKATISGS